MKKQFNNPTVSFLEMDIIGTEMAISGKGDDLVGDAPARVNAAESVRFE